MEKQNENSFDYVSSLLNTYSSLSEYFEEIAYHLNCEISDLRMLESQDDNDEEGWEIKLKKRKCFMRIIILKILQ